MISQNISAIGHGYNKTLSKNLFNTYFAIEWNPLQKNSNKTVYFKPIW